MKLVRVAIDRPVTVLMFFAAVILLGYVSLQQLSVDLLPGINYPRLSVMTQYAGVAPEEIETLVSAPLESAVSRIPGLRRVESTSKEGVSFLTLEFAWGTDMDFTLLHLRGALDGARLPEHAGKPVIISLDPKSEPIAVLALTGSGTLLDVKELAEELIKPRLEQIEGVGAAEISGGVEREIQVELDPQRLALYGLTVEQVAAGIDAFNRNMQGGTVRKGMSRYTIRVVGELESLKEIAAIRLKTTALRGIVRLQDVARIRDAIKERQGLTRLDGRESIGILVHKDAGANTVKVTRFIRAVIAQIRKETPRLNLVVVSEQAKYIESAINAVKNEIIQGMIIVFLIVLLFLQEWKTPLIILGVLAISVIATFNLLYFGGITLNLMSLGGLALGVGMLDDCADVISENIFRHRGLGKSLAEAAYVGTSELGAAMISTALTTVVVFLPIVYVHGLAGQLFRDSALTVTFSLLASLLVSLTLLPMLQARRMGERSFTFFPVSRPAADSSGADRRRGWRRLREMLFLSARGVHWIVYKIVKGVYRVFNLLVSLLVQLLTLALRYLALPFRPLLNMAFTAFNRLYNWFVPRYRGWLEWSLDNKGKVALASLAFFAVSFFVATQVDREHMPKVEALAFELRLQAPVDYSLQQTSAFAASLERFLNEIPAVRTTFAQIGIAGNLKSVAADVSLQAAKIFVSVRKTSDFEKVLERLRRKLGEFPGLNYSLRREQSTLEEFLAFSGAEVVLKIKGAELSELAEIALQLQRRLGGIPGIVDLSSNIGRGKPELLLHIRKEAIEKYPGLSPETVSRFLVDAVSGKVATQFYEMEKKYDILVRFAENARSGIETLLESRLPYMETSLPIKELVRVEMASGPLEIRREDQQREVFVTANLHNVALSRVVSKISAAIAAIRLPEGYRIEQGGEQQEMSRSFKSLIWALLLSVLLTYMIMAAQFESLLHPLLVMLTLPMGAAGAYISLYVTGQTVNVISIIGMVVLVGLVVDDAIVEIDYINLLRRNGSRLRDAVVEGCMTRLRAILMASLDTAFGLVPMALGLEHGSELLRPLGVVVFGGLIFSTFLTLIQIPVLYEWMESRKRGAAVTGGAK